MFVRNEDFRSFLRHYPLVSIIIAINLIIFLAVNLLPSPIGRPGGTITTFMVEWHGGIEQGQYWRLITPIFLHIGFSHVLFNSFWTVLFAPALERILGKWKFVVAYLGTGIIGNIATYYLLDPRTLSFGASGAIFGLFGIYIYMVLFRKDLIDRPSSSIVIWIAVFAVITTFFTQGVNIVAHLFGLIGGLLLGPPLLSRVPQNFSWQPSVIKPRKHYQDTEVTFNPNRWRKRKKRNDLGKKIIWGLFALFILLGIVSMFFR
ncbi:MAG TPA: rhomboid family intramembrane serine protease [Bacillales bacterium]|nr:rhomboid family intramembrane serine protease [Bacillales bacterium]